MADKPGLGARLNYAALSVLPQHALSGLMYRAARCRVRWFKNAFIRFIVSRFKVDLDEAAVADLDHYEHFNAFFTRELKPGVHVIDPDPMAIVSPADGRISQTGTIDGDRILQAKGHDYTTRALLGGDQEAAARYQDGQFCTVYLSPRDYHRVHMPLDGRLVAMDFVPGELFSVSDATAQLVPGLFARNERVVCHFEGEHGPFVMVLVGAIFVGSMQTVWHGEVRAPGKQVTRWTYDETDAPRLKKGEEMGRFNMGSTVVLLTPPGTRLDRTQAGQAVRLGQALGTADV